MAARGQLAARAGTAVWLELEVHLGAEPTAVAGRTGVPRGRAVLEKAGALGAAGVEARQEAPPAAGVLREMREQEVLQGVLVVQIPSIA